METYTAFCLFSGITCAVNSGMTNGLDFLRADNPIKKPALISRFFYGKRSLFLDCPWFWRQTGLSSHIRLQCRWNGYAAVCLLEIFQYCH